MNALLTTLGAQGSASGGSASGGSMTTTFITFGLIILIFYFLIIRPQKKRDKDAKDMLASMKKGDKVVTIGGIRGTIVNVKETTVVLKVDDNTKIEFSKNAVGQILDKKAEAASEKAPEKVEAPEKKKKTTSTKKVEQEKSEEPSGEEEPTQNEEN
ncbi:MAG: preprotein translocase subunit YajC [Sphaerochaetaceae bacterium]